MYLNFKGLQGAVRKRLCTLVLACLSLCLAFPLFATDFQMPPSVASGESEGGNSKKSLVSRGTFKLLESVQKSIDRDLYDEAFEKLNRLILRVQENPYEAAVVLKTAAYLYIRRDEQTKAAELMRHAVNMNQLVHENQQKLRFDLAQILLNDGQHDEAITLLETWLDKAKKEEITPSIYIRLGNAYLQAENHVKTSFNFERAIAASEEAKEYYYQLLLASYVVQEKLTPAIQLLKKMLVLFPEEKKYSLQLVGLYDQNSQPEKALQVLQLAYQKRQLDQTEEYASLAYRLLDARYPLKAATILKEGMDKFIVWITPQNLNLLAQAYISSKQESLAIPVLEKAIRTAETPNTALILSQLYLKQKNYSSAIRSLQDAFATANAKQKIEINLQLANTYFLDKNEEQAKLIYESLLVQPALNKKQRKMVESWRRYLNRQS